MLPKYLRDPARAKLQSRMSPQGYKAPGSLTTCCQLINNLLGTYASDEIVAMAEADVTKCVQKDCMTESEFEAFLWKKESRCCLVFSVDKLKGIYIEGPNKRIIQNVRNHWASHPDVELPEKSRYAKAVESI